MAWFWSDDLAKLLIERDGVAPEALASWRSGPTAYRSDLGALEFARRLLAETGPDVEDTQATSAA